MKKMRKWVLLSFLLVPLLALAPGCSEDNNTGGGGFFFIPIVDLAVTDFDFQDLDDLLFDEPQILLYFDVLNDPDGDLQDPDVVLNATDSGLDWPRHLLFTEGGDLLAGNRDSTGGIDIWRDYRSLSNGAVPDVSLTDDGGGAGTMADIADLAYGNNNLIAAGYGDDLIFIFNDASGITANGPPDVALSMSVDTPDGLYYNVDDDQLYVGQEVTSSTDECVLRYDNVSGITADQAPDAVLGVDVSFFDIGYCDGVLVDETNDNLFVATNDNDDDSPHITSFIYMFMGASTFNDDALPDAVITFTGTQGKSPMRMALHNDRLFVANRNVRTDSEADNCDALPGAIAFDLNGVDADGFPNGTIQWGQNPSVDLGHSISGVSASQHIVSAGGFLFVHNFSGCEEWEGFGDVRIFSGENGGPQTGDSPFITLPSLKDFATPVEVTAILRDDL